MCRPVVKGGSSSDNNCGEGRKNEEKERNKERKRKKGSVEREWCPLTNGK